MIALRQHGADAGDGLRIAGFERQFAYLAHIHLQVLGGAHDKAAGTGGAFVVGLEGAHAPVGREANGTGGLAADIEHGGRFGKQEPGAAGGAGDFSYLRIAETWAVAAKAGGHHIRRFPWTQVGHVTGLDQGRRRRFLQLDAGLYHAPSQDAGRRAVAAADNDRLGQGGADINSRRVPHVRFSTGQIRNSGPAFPGQTEPRRWRR